MATTFTIFATTKPSVIGKVVKDFGNKKPESAVWAHKTGSIYTAVSMTYRRGTFSVQTVQTLEELADVLHGLEPGRQFLTAGVPEKVTEGEYTSGAETPGRLRKTNSNFQLAKGQGGLFIIDTDDAIEPEHVLEQLEEVGLGGVGCVWRPSSSSHLYDRSGTKLSGLKGSHFYFRCADASDIHRAGEVLFKRLWLMEYGWIKVSKPGAALKRSAYDMAMRTSSQPCFAAGAHCLGGVEQRWREPIVFDAEVEVLDTKALLPDLTPVEERHYARLVADAEKAAEPECEAARVSYAADQCRARLKREPTSQEVDAAAAALKKTETGVLELDFPVVFKDGAVRTVREILADGMTYHRAVVADPVEPEYWAGMLFLDRWPNLHSRAGAQITYELGTSQERTYVRSAAGRSLLEKLKKKEST